MRHRLQGQHSSRGAKITFLKKTLDRTCCCMRPVSASAAGCNPARVSSCEQRCRLTFDRDQCSGFHGLVQCAGGAGAAGHRRLAAALLETDRDRSLYLQDFMAVCRALEEQGLPVADGSLQYVPLVVPDLDDEVLEANERMHDVLLAVDDVDDVWTNYSD